MGPVHCPWSTNVAALWLSSKHSGKMCGRELDKPLEGHRQGFMMSSQPVVPTPIRYPALRDDGFMFSSGSSDVDRRCTARSSRTGEQCRKYAVKGGIVCGTHRGRAPQVNRAAAERVDRDQASRLGLRLSESPTSWAALSSPERSR